MDWQPIETAPKDGTVIDLWVSGAGSDIDARGAAFVWDTDHGWVTHARGEPLTWFYDADDVVPTHWMPLPEPPKD